MKTVADYIRTIPDFPEPGIMFRDVTSVLQDPDGLKLAIDEMAKLCGDPDEIDAVVGLESRGFIFGMPLAYNLHKPFILVRKKGKLPCETIEQTYDLEYGSATIEMHKDSIKPGQKVVVVANLKPRKLRGVESKGMLLFADNVVDGKERVEFVSTIAEDGNPVT